MVTLRIIWSAIGLIAGIVLAAACRVPVHGVVLAVASTLGLAFSLRSMLDERQWRVPALVPVVLAAILFALPVGYWRTMQKIGPPVRGSLRHVLEELEDGSPMVLQGRLAAEPEVRGVGQGDIKLAVTQVDLPGRDPIVLSGPSKVMVRVYFRGTGESSGDAAFSALMVPEAYGYQLRVDATYRTPRRALNPGEFDLAAFLLQNDLVARVRCHVKRVEILERSRGNVLVEMALEAKRRFLEAYKRSVLGPASRLAAAATLGSRRVVEGVSYRGKEIAATFRHAGVGHVLAVSGLHVSVVALLLYSLFRVAGVRPRLFTPAVILFLILFALLTGARPSSVRAVVMNSVILLAMAYFHCGLRRATGTGLALSALVILVLNPIAFFSPGFLLSFGAVLSLVLIATPLTRWLVRLRGLSLVFFVLWFVLVMSVSGRGLRLFLDAPHTLGLLGLLWLLLLTGGRLNERYPGFLKLGLDRLPVTVQFFFSAQLAIQIGMMIPLSAWFFGRFPVAGVLVNLVAIPAIGVLIQLAMLTGVASLLPVVGCWLALPFGAATAVVGFFFFELAHAGATGFPYPAVTKPSLVWMLTYYAGIGVLLLLDARRVWVRGVIRRGWLEARRQHWRVWACWGAASLLVFAPALKLLPRAGRVERVTCLASGRHPLMTLVSRNGNAVTVNAGDAGAGEWLLFETLRRHGATSVDLAIVCGTDPRQGNAGLAQLARKMPVSRCLLPVVVDDPAGYLEAIGDTYLIDQARAGKGWALAYGEAHTELTEVLSRSGAVVGALRQGAVVRRSGLEIDALNRVGSVGLRRFASSVGTAILGVTVGDYRWLVVTDTVVGTLRDAVSAVDAPYDVLVVADLSHRKDYRDLLDTAVDRAWPRVVIVAGERAPRGIDLRQWARDRDRPFELLVMASDGAVEATFPRDGSLRLRAFAGREIRLAAPLGYR